MEGSGPSIKLKVRSTTPPPATTTSSPPPKSKKRRFVPPSSLPETSNNKAEANNLRLLHQKSHLSFFLHSPSPLVEPEWYAQGKSTLYLADTASSSLPGNPGSIQLALHLRRTCQVTEVQVEGMKERNGSALIPVPCSFVHLDPLQKVLLKPATSYTMDDVISKTPKHEADSQSSRGAAGMTNGIRAASIASNLGELRITTTTTTTNSNKPKERSNIIEKATEACWKNDLALPYADGAAVANLKEQLAPREEPRKQARLDLIAKALASNRSAWKVTVHYKVLLGGDLHHFGGIHAMTKNQQPHIYTTAGVFGDHEGPRCW
eukprot:scaffold24926_cov250-Cylindrotheca_fusiformis.AAC.1